MNNINIIKEKHVYLPNDMIERFFNKDEELKFEAYNDKITGTYVRREKPLIVVKVTESNSPIDKPGDEIKIHENFLIN